MFEPVTINKKKGPLFIENKRWYFRLVSDKEKYSRRSRALMDDYTLNQIANHLVICFTPNKIPGNVDTFRTKNGDLIHLYAFFNDYIEFYHYMNKFPENERTFYEVIFGELPQKPHFDIDVSMDDIASLCPGDNIDTIAETLREGVIMACIELIENINIETEYINI